MYRTRRPITEFPRLPDDGFTLVELMIVITIVGILATIGTANYISFQAKAKYASCIENQHSIHEAAMLYGSDNDIGTVNINVQVLTAANLITANVAECPSSATKDFDDYNISYVNERVTDVDCTILPNEHSFTP